MRLIETRSRLLITSSARANTDCGLAKRICLAVLRLITISNLVGCSTGRTVSPKRDARDTKYNVSVRRGQTTSTVKIDVGSDMVITASTTNEAVDDLALKPGDRRVRSSKRPK